MPRQKSEQICPLCKTGLAKRKRWNEEEYVLRCSCGKTIEGWGKIYTQQSLFGSVEEKEKKRA